MIMVSNLFVDWEKWLKASEKAELELRYFHRLLLQNIFGVGSAWKRKSRMKYKMQKQQDVGCSLRALWSPAFFFSSSFVWFWAACVVFLNPFPLFGRRGCEMENNRVTQRFCAAGKPNVQVKVLGHHCGTAAWTAHTRTGRKKDGACQRWGENKIRGLDKTQDHFPPRPPPYGTLHRHPVITAA